MGVLCEILSPIIEEVITGLHSVYDYKITYVKIKTFFADLFWVGA